MDKKKKFEQFAAQICRILLIWCFTGLLILSFLSSGKNDYMDSEAIYTHWDNVVCNGIILILGMFLLVFLAKFLMKIRNIDLLAVCLSIFSGILCMLWVHASSTKPVGDQELICYFADAFNSGDFAGLERVNYVGVCQHQLGLITYARALFALFGSDYHVFQYMNAVWVAVIVFAGYKFTNLLTKSKFVKVVYLILTVTYIPLFIYSPFVYGEIPSIAVCFLCAWMFLECFQNMRWYKPLILGALIGWAVLLRENSLIMGIAMIIATAVKIVSNLSDKKKTKRNVYILVSIIVGIVGMQCLIYKGVYGNRIPEDSHSMPSILYIAMGTTYSYRSPGVYNAYNIVTFMDAGYDVDTAKGMAKETITEFVAYCKENPDYAIQFYFDKLKDQWNVPLQQCFTMTNQFEKEITPLVRSIYDGPIQDILERFMNGWQLLVYFFLLMNCLLKKNEKVEKMVLLITIFGGVLFSILWEAKARYVLPYIIMMIPYAANGFSLFVKSVLERYRSRQEYER